jgi:hypothetical protein
MVNLAARLTKLEDRETYAALLSYFDSLPPGDELLRLAQLLGLLSLLGQRVPDAIAELLIEVREQTAAAAEYHAQLDRRLASLPQEITAGVDAGAIATGMGEAFRQQLTATGLENTATLLRNASREMTALTGQITTSLRLLTRNYKIMAATISAELEKLTIVSDRLQEHNARLLQQERKSAWLWQGVLALVLFLAGGLCGILVEKHQTTDVLSEVGAQIQQPRTSALQNPELRLRKDQIP